MNRTASFVPALGIAAVLQSACAYAISPELLLSQLHHSRWSGHDGAPAGIESLVQTSDGYVWVAASAGLFRFDGVQFERIDSIGGRRLPSNNILNLQATPDGGLWIGYRFGGASFVSQGTVKSYGEREGLPAASVSSFAVDPAGTVWASTTRGLKRFDGSGWEDVRETFGLPSEYAESMHVARDGTLWVVIGRSLMFLRPGQAAFGVSDIEMSDEDADFAEAPDGTLWLFDQSLGARAVYAPGRTAPIRKGWIALRDARGEPLWGKLVDRDGAMWLTSAAGIHRLKDAARLLDPGSTGNPQFDVTADVDGLSWTQFLEDREGNVWVGTAVGIDRFRESRLTPVEFPRAANGFAMAAGDAGAMLVGIDSEAGVFEVKGASAPTLVRGPKHITCAYRGTDGVVWFGGRGVIWRSAGPGARSTRWLQIAAPVDQANAGFHPVQAMTLDGAGRLWVSLVRAGNFHLDAGNWIRHEGNPALTITAGADGRAWLGFPGSRVQAIDAGKATVREFGIDDGLDLGNVLSIHARTRNVWVGGELGLARFDGKRFQPLELSGGRSLSSVTGIVMTPEGELWLSTSDGAIRITAREVGAFSADPRHAVGYELFDYLDGMPGTPNGIRPLPSLAAGSDGRLWFATTSGLAWIDPKRVRTNAVVPNVEVRSIVADGKRHAPGPGLELPVGVRTLQINYTGLSFAIPERVRFRYRLGADEPWQEAGPRRSAYFTRLDPGDYTFHVTAANDAGVWNETGASVDFSVPPAFHQTRWFYALVALTFAALLILAYRVRMRQVAGQVRDRLEARLAERERIARDLHDTLLQGIQGLIWRFQAAADRIPPDEPARSLMEQSLERADKLLGESRDKVKELRPAASEIAHLELAIAAEAEQFSKDHPASFRASVQGTRRDLHPMVREECFLVSREALSNAFQHAHAGNIEAEVTYGDSALHVRIRDDGQGISGEVLDAGERPGHFGLLGMRERAKRLGAHLEVWSKPGAGTEVELRVPADVAYRLSTHGAHGVRARLAHLASSAQESS